jgi:maltose O-acetyltransferase
VKGGRVVQFNGRGAKAWAKSHAPDPVLRLAAVRRDVWSDLRLRLLSEVGFLPSHHVRKFFYRQAGMTIPDTTSIHWRCEFYAPELIVFGEHCTIGDTCFLDGRSGLEFGDAVNLGSHVSIYTREHSIDDPDFAETGAPVKVDDRAWIASHAIVLPGVSIGEGAVVAAGAVVVKDVPAFTLVGGNPARVIRERSTNLRYELGYAKRFV